MEKVSNIKFNFTKKMATQMISINNLKKQLIELNEQKKQNLNKDDYLILEHEYDNIIKEIEQCKKEFIKEFQKQNQKQIKQYLNSKNN